MVSNGNYTLTLQLFPGLSHFKGRALLWPHGRGSHYSSERLTLRVMPAQPSYIGQFRPTLSLCLRGIPFVCTSVLFRGDVLTESVTEIRDKRPVTVQLGSQGHRETLLEFTIAARGRPLRITPVCFPAACCKGTQNNLDAYGPVAFSMVSWRASSRSARE